MNGKKKILAISGSTRVQSSNETILRTIADRHKEFMDLTIFDSIAKLPHFNPDMDREEADIPDVIRRFREQVDQADGVLICTPEYVFSLPGALKNAIEWTVSTMIFSNKPVGIIVASASGEKALESLVLIMNTVGASIGKSKLLLRGARGKLNAHGEISDVSVLEEIDGLVKSFIQSIEAGPTEL